MAFFDQQKAREHYLERLLARYGTVTLPLASVRHALPLQTIFQPMVLRRDPFAPQNKQSPEESDVVKAKDGTEALAKSEQRRMVVLGGPGMGKTTALKALLHQAITAAQIDPSAPLPLFISLPDLARTGLSLEEYIQQVIAELEVDPHFARILTDAVHAGNAFLCLDSLDEVLPALRPDVIAFLNQEAVHSQGTWIIGSRFTEYKGGQFAHSQFAEWELQALDKQARLTLAQQLLPALYDALYGDMEQNQKPAMPSAQAYVWQLQGQAQIATWGENPLLFSLTAVLYIQAGSLPGSRAVLYAQVTEAMFTMRIHDAAQLTHVRSVLAEMALEFYQTQGRSFRITDVLEWLPSQVPDQNTQSLYDTLTQLLDSGVLEPVAYQTYGFKHQMFQEYLAAVVLARHCLNPTQRESAWELLWRKRRLSRWNEILRLLVGILVQEHGVEGLQVVREWLSALAMEQSTSEGDPGNLCLILAMESLDEMGEHVSEAGVEALAQQILEQWAKRLTELLSLGGRQYAQPLRERAYVLHAFNLQIVAPLIMRLQQFDPDIQQFCHIPVPVSVLWHLFHDRSTSFDSCHSVLETPEIITRLVAILEDTSGKWNTKEQVAAVKLLEGLGEKTPVSLLIQIWQNQAHHDELRTSAAKVLSEPETPAPLDIFVAMLHDHDASIRSIAVKALSQRDGQAHIDLLVSALQDPDMDVYEDAFRCLRELGVSFSIEQLQTLLYIDGAVDLLQEMGDRVPLDLWIDALLQPKYHDTILEAAPKLIEQIEQHKDQISVEPILAMLSHRKKAESTIDIQICTTCIWVLELLGDRVPLEPLLELLHHSNKYIQSQAFSVLTQRHVTLPVDILLPMLKDYWHGGKAAAQAIAAMGEHAPISSLLEAVQSSLRSYSSDGARSASQALRLLYEYVPTEPILELLQDKAFRNLYGDAYWELIQLLQLQGVEISLELFLPLVEYLLKRHLYHSTDTDVTPVIAAFFRAGAQAHMEALLRLTYNTSSWLTDHPEGAQRIFYTLYEWISPESLTNALGNMPTDQWLAIDLLSEAPDDESIQLIIDVVQDPARDHTTRSQALSALSDLEVYLPLEFLLQATHWWNFYEKWWLIEAVKHLGEQTPIEQLLPLLGTDQDITAALASIAQYIPLEIILPLLKGDDQDVRHAALRILAAMGERTPFDVFRALLSDSEQPRKTRSVVIEALGRSGTAAAVDLLVETLNDDDPEIRSDVLFALQAEEMLAEKGGLRAFKEQGKKIPLESVLKLFDDPDLIEHAIDVSSDLARLDLVTPVEPLIERLVSFLDSEDEDLLDNVKESIVGEVAEALCKFGKRVSPDILDILLANLYKRKNRQIFEDAFEGIFKALGTLGDHTLLDAMLVALPDDDKIIADSIEITDTLENLAESMPEEILKRLHDDPRPSIRRIVLLAIQATKACEWLPLVLDTLHDADGRYAAYDHRCPSPTTIREAIIEALGALSACAPLELLIQLLHIHTKESNYLHFALVEALKQLGWRIPVTVMWPLLGSDNRDVCRLAFKYLQEAHPDVLKELVPTLKAIVRGEPVQGAFAARLPYRIAETVAMMGRATPAVLEMVIDLLDYPFWEVRGRAAQALGTLRRNIPDRAIRRLLELRKDDESPDVRVAADQALADILSLEQGMEEE